MPGRSTWTKYVKLEIDINPPAGSAFETSYLTFPTTVPVTTQSLGSGFGTKAHALLCRKYVKGRDWYDFVWYVSRRTLPDLQLLASALSQQGPWKGTRVDVTPEWFVSAMTERIQAVNWATAQSDVQRFLPLSEQAGLRHWNMDFFLYQVERMADYIT